MTEVNHTGGDSERVRWRAAALSATFTSMLFFVCYGGAAYLTEMRDDVGIWYYQWERWIPFVPIMIVPYMSIDLFFFAAPFTCSTRQELSILTRRLAAVVVVASVCFLIYPLQLAVERPHATGLFGMIYNWFTSMDRPYNLCPSMHIALRTVLAAHYGKHCRGVIRWLMNVWFVLIGLSTLLLYQHHVIDVVGGFVLAVLVMYVIDGLPWRLPKVGDTRFALIYGGIGAAILAPVFWIPKLGWLLIWPAVSSGIVAIGYAWAGPAVYRRRNGKLTWPCRFVLGPVLAAQWLSWRYYAGQSNAVDQVTDGVFIGRHLTNAEASQHVAKNFHATVDVCNAFSEPDALLAANHLKLPILDLTAPTDEQFDEACAFIETSFCEGVFVHCKAGYSRSAGLVAAWLLQSGRAESIDEAFETLQRVRPNIVFRPEIRRSLERWLER